MLLSETYKKRLKQLAGILKEAQGISQAEKESAFASSDSRIPFSVDLMTQAIQQGREIGILFQSNNEKYKMPVAKYRTIYPVAMGTSKNGKQVVRALHRIGQSERKAIETGKRSAEAYNEWRLFKTENIKGMWFTGNFFRALPPSYNSTGDKSMTNVNVQTNLNDVRRYQKELFQNLEKEEKRKSLLKKFKETGERPIEQPIRDAEIEDAQEETQEIEPTQQEQPVQQEPTEPQEVSPEDIENVDGGEIEPEEEI